MDSATGPGGGLFFWGWATDRLTARAGSPTALRGLFAALAVLNLPLALAPGLGSAGLVLGALALAMFISGGFIIAGLAYGTDTFPAANSGLVGGLASGSWSTLVAVAMPFFGRMFDQSRDTTAFAVAAGAPLAGFVAWWVLSRPSRVQLLPDVPADQGETRVGVADRQPERLRNQQEQHTPDVVKDRKEVSGSRKGVV